MDLAMARLERDDEPTRRQIQDNLDHLFERSPDGLSPRWLSGAREALITWETRGRRLH